MNYEETLDWLFKQLPVFQKQGGKALKIGLGNIIKLSEYLQSPEKKFKTIHVAGTNGKGSTSHIIASILQEAGYIVGLYTSPHLKDFRERIRVNGNRASEQFVIQFVKEHQAFLEAEGLSFFEMTVGMAFDYFAKKKVDIAVIEVGLGGRFDATNIITPEVSVITNIGFDHLEFLGDTLPKIAFEKAGIIKKNIPVVISEFHEETFPVFTERAKEEEAVLYLAEETIQQKYQTDLLGDYQQKNCKAAVQAVQLLEDFQIEETHIKKGLLNVVTNTKLQGRWQILHQSPKTICDTAHNKEGLAIAMQQLQAENFQELHIVLGVVKDKKLEAILPLLPKNARYYFCSPKIIRGLSATELQEKAAQQHLIGNVYDSVSEAYHAAKTKATNKDVIYIGGSTFVVAEIV
ncbi:bifunctional folylpolyglutamate synthase/dihydrofolate synthase [Kordia sp. YSTF-M3]|uniref:Dihydrofolate synthase/folylpolyglutamate synthase n=1 Tax=Kordia aestuariivivens TaxID=2759037 RepID=A0ABR7QB10_9FLAO|nr:folylpolyglutamate synthase/dihydrofolate synthase family protein [Kordia aestuariivivens]MBC8755683.1 bifunctional folylpolyglutamate synthase/dihydrofolate synthase [Kordia aestuariivivens]